MVDAGIDALLNIKPAMTDLVKSMMRRENTIVADTVIKAVYPLIRQQVISEEIVQMMRNVDGCDSCQEAIRNLKDKTDE